MHCGECRERFSEYLDGRLEEAARADLDRHLAGCLACARELADLRAVVGAVQAMPAESVPEGFVGRVHERVRPRRAVAWRWAAVSAAAAVLALAAVAVFGPARHRAPSVMNTLASGGGEQGFRDGHVLFGTPKPKGAAPSAESAPAARAVEPTKQAASTPAAEPAGEAKGPAPPRTAASTPRAAPLAERVPAVTTWGKDDVRMETNAEREAQADVRHKSERREAFGRYPPAPVPGPKAGAEGVAGRPEEARTAGPAPSAPPPTAAAKAVEAPAEQPSIEYARIAPSPEAGEAGKPSPMALDRVAADRAAWCVVTLRKPATEPAGSPAPGPAQGDTGGLRLALGLRVAASDVALAVQAWRPGPVLGDVPLRGGLAWHGDALGVAPWHAGALSPGGTRVIPLDWLEPRPAPDAIGGMRLRVLGHPAPSAVYRLTLSSENLPACNYLLFVPSERVEPTAVVPPGPAVDVLRRLTAQAGIYLLVPERVVSTVQVALPPMPPEQALGSALATMGLAAHKEGRAWTVR